ncbi:hypothetical protein SAMN05216316_3009 [Nitrosovibrio sp. Nv6]|nr:hypothetical protein SAMN05216316_3009 [Nitrosovibrio sp. Nv6]
MPILFLDEKILVYPRITPLAALACIQARTQRIQLFLHFHGGVGKLFGQGIGRNQPTIALYENKPR